MYEVESKKSGCDVINRAKNEHGQTMQLSFESWSFTFKNKEQWFVRFYISTKRKHGYKYLEQTGKDGISGLLWAKRCLIDFIENGIDRKKDNQVVIYWDDNRRQRVYEYALSKLGFNVEFIDRRKALVLKINAE